MFIEIDLDIRTKALPEADETKLLCRSMKGQMS